MTTTRQKKTPRQRAEEALGVATRRHDKARAEVMRLKTVLKEAETALDEAMRRRQYASEDPALKTGPTTTQEVQK